MTQPAVRRRHFDEELPDDVEEILDVAAQLEIREFDVFHLAHNWWFGRESTERDIEPYFTEYMFRRTVPHWVRQFTRDALSRRTPAGELDRRDFGLAKLPEATVQSVSRGLRYFVIAICAISALIIMAESSYKVAGIGRCIFPPCY